MSEDTLYIISESVSAEIEVRKSVFIATASLLESAQPVKSMVQAQRTLHHKARHVVWAYVIGEGSQQSMGMSDDGEPQGTAGRPVMTVLEKAGLTNILLTVVRYFGGTKLGRGGLLRAYTDATRAVLEKTPRQALIHTAILNLALSYELHKTVGKLIENHQVRVLSIQYDDRVHLQCELPESKVSDFRTTLINATNNRILIHE
jgi:uncharacterized YigZ family protein